MSIKRQMIELVKMRGLSWGESWRTYLKWCEDSESERMEATAEQDIMRLREQEKRQDEETATHTP